MFKRNWAAAIAAALIAASVMAPAALARNRGGDRGRRAADRGGSAVFVQTDESSGNRIVVFDRGTNGRLTRAASYLTGGNGGTAQPGNQSDHLASQGSLAYDPVHKLLIAVNAGSDSLSTFVVHGDRLRLTGVVPSGGHFPASVTVHGDLVYVLDSGDGGTVHGFRIDGNQLRSIDGSGRSLGLDTSNPPFFLTAPGQVGFSPDGSQLIVTTKVSGSTIDVFAVHSDGRLSSAPVRNPSATPVPFAFTFTPSGRIAVGEAGASNVSTYLLDSDGTLADPKSASDGQTALCWILRVGRFYYVSNTGSNTLSGFRISDAGQPSLITASGIVATTEPGPIDLTSPPGTRLLYAETGGGTVQEFRVNDDGTLTKLGVVRDLPQGIEGIAST